MSGGRPWSEAELEVLRAHRDLRGPDVADLLPGRSLRAIRDARARFKLPLEARVCSLDACERVTHARGLCSRHYRKAMGHNSRLKDHKKRDGALRAGKALHPPTSLPFRALAKSCPECGDLVTTPDEWLRRSVGRNPTCGPCAVVRTRAHKLSDPQAAAKAAEHERRSADIRAARALIAERGAPRHGYQWTGPDLEIAARPDLSLARAALMLGRTEAAVQAARQRIREEPKWAQVVGLGRVHPLAGVTQSQGAVA